jgi:hypothetical protein
MHRPLRFAALGIATLIGAFPVAARELGRAPDLHILGFSADGRYFGLEQDGNDGVSEHGAFAIDVVDSSTGRSLAGFPRGATQLAFQAQSTDPRRIALSGFRFKEHDETTTATELIRRWARGASRPALRALRLTDPGRRLGGYALTDLSETTGPVKVMDQPDIIGAHPGTAMKYTVTATLPVPADPDLACRERETSETHRLTITLAPEIPSFDRDAATRAPRAFRSQSVDLIHTLPPKTCFTRAQVTDVVRSRNGRGIAVVVALIYDVGFTDSAEYRATVFRIAGD